MARRSDIVGRMLHTADKLDDVVDADTITKEERKFIEHLAQLYLRGGFPDAAEMQQATAIDRKITGEPPPVGALVMGNNKGFVPPDLHELFVADKSGLGPRPWLLKFLDEGGEWDGSPKAERLRRILRTYFGAEYARVIRDSIKTAKVSNVFSPDSPVPNFEATWSGITWRRYPLGERMVKRDQADLLVPLLKLDTRGLTHFLRGRTNPRIVDALERLLQRQTPEELARRILHRSAYRPTQITRAYIWHMKGILFERLIEPAQIARLEDALRKFGGPGKTVALVRGAKVRLRGPDGKPGPLKDFSDGLIIVVETPRRGRPVLRVVEVHEAKSGKTGDYTSLMQTDRWTGKVDEVGELVLPPEALVNWVHGMRTKTAEPFSKFLGALGERRLSRRLEDQGWAIAANVEQLPKKTQRQLRAEVKFDVKADPIFLANSRYDPPDLSDDLMGFFPFQIEKATVMPNLVAEELECISVRLLEVVAEELLTTTKSLTPRHLELTTQVLKELP